MAGHVAVSVGETHTYLPRHGGSSPSTVVLATSVTENSKEDVSPVAQDTAPITSDELEQLRSFLGSEAEQYCGCLSSKAQMHMVNGTLQVIRGLSWAGSRSFYLIGYVLLVVAWVLILGIIGGWYTVLSPYLRLALTTPQYILHFLFAHWLLINIVFNYLFVSITKPGAPPKLSHAEIAVRMERGEGSYCKKCDNFKPPRTHHCSVCQQCVLKMDHHCPWVHNCIGLYNHRYFFLFMAYLWVGCVYIAAVSYPVFKKIDAVHLARDHPEMRAEVRYATENQEMLSFCFFLTLAVGFALGILLFWHVVLVSRNMTTLESYVPKSKSTKLSSQSYNLGFANNWKQFFGFNEQVGWMAIIIPSVYRPDLDGIVWPRPNNDVKHV
eukprot:m.211583 g.211583  ORF g.211583 m.211583 type:complete len:381 (+) comp15064_c0_seq2:309-1451(+)